MNEPTVLDYVKAKLFPWKYARPAPENDANAPGTSDQPDRAPSSEAPSENITSEKVPALGRYPLEIGPLRLGAGLLIALLAQVFLDNPDGQRIGIAGGLYVLSGLLTVWAILQGEWKLEFKAAQPSEFRPLSLDTRRIYLLTAGFILLVLSYFAFKGNQFTTFNLFVWALTLACFVLAFYDPKSLALRWEKVRKIIQDKRWDVTITPGVLAVGIVVIVVLFFRFYRLDSVLGEMFSDHAEKLLDVHDVLQGDTKLYFPRNTGREFIQFYLTAFVSIVFGSGLSFLSLKIGTALAGLFTLPYLYALGKELANKRVALVAVFLTGISYWANLISRIGLRFPLYPLFVAPTLFYVMRGLRQKRRNDFMYAGISLGLSLHGYSSTRFLPLVVVFIFLLYLLHTWRNPNKQQVLLAFTILVLISIVLFMPLFSYLVEDPGGVTGRSLSRLGTTERAYLESPLRIFFENLKDAWLMPFLSNGNTWVHSVPLRPALDIISAAVYFLGSLYVLVRYIQKRHWEDIVLLASVPLLMMPSILSLAFPEENPSLNRTAGAIIPVFLLAAIGLEGVFSNLWRRSKTNIGKLIQIGFWSGLLISTCWLNYDLVFHQFHDNFIQNAWNTSQIGEVIHGWSISTGNKDNAYVVPYPHWVDTRLVGINAGYPTKDYALWPDRFEETRVVQGAKLFILKPDDAEALVKLQTMYPQGVLTLYDSGRNGKDFYMYEIPAQSSLSH